MQSGESSGEEDGVLHPRPPGKRRCLSSSQESGLAGKSRAGQAMSSRRYESLVGVCMEGETGTSGSTAVGLVTVPCALSPLLLTAKCSTSTTLNSCGVVTPSSSVTASSSGSSDVTPSSSLNTSCNLSVADLRKVISKQLTFLPQNFTFLTKQGWPITSGQEEMVAMDAVLAGEGHVRLRNSSGRDVCRLGVVDHTTQCSLGYVDALYSSPVNELRHMILGQLTNLSQSQVEYANFQFVERNGWPVNPAQESNLTVLDLIRSGAVHIRQSSLPSVAMTTRGQPATPTSLSSQTSVHTPLAQNSPLHSSSAWTSEQHESPSGGNSLSGNRSWKLNNASPSHGQLIAKDSSSSIDINISEHQSKPNADHDMKLDDALSPAERARSMSEIVSSRSMLAVKSHAGGRSPSPSRHMMGQQRQSHAMSLVQRGVSSPGGLGEDCNDANGETVAAGPPEPVQGGKHFFISYVRAEGSQQAKLLKKLMSHRGYSVYLDVCEIKGGHDWQDSISNAISDCSVFVPLVTPRYGETLWTNREVKLADRLAKKIIPVSFIEEWPPMCLAIQFVTLQFIPWKTASEDFTSSQEEMQIAAVEVIEKIFEVYEIEGLPGLPSVQYSPQVSVTSATSSMSATPASLAQKPHSHHSVPSLTRTTPIGKEVRMRKSGGFSTTHLLEYSRQLSRQHDGPPLVVLVSDSTQKKLVKSITVAMKDSKINVWASHPKVYPAGKCTASSDKSRWSFCPKARRQQQLQREQAMKGCDSKCKEFATKVNQAAIVVFLLSKTFAFSDDCMKQMYYCEHRKHVIPLVCEDYTLPSWIHQLLGGQTIKKACGDPTTVPWLVSRIQSLFSAGSGGGNVDTYIEQGLPMSPADESLVCEKAEQIRSTLPEDSFLVFVAGSVEFHSTLSPGLCCAIGTLLAKMDNVTLITGGYAGVGLKVAQHFLVEREKYQRPANTFHAVAMDTCGSGEVVQSHDAAFQPAPGSKELVCGANTAVQHRVLAHLADIVILIEGGHGAAHEVELSAWNDTVIVPIMATGGAAAGEFPVPQAVFDCPANASLSDWNKLRDNRLRPEEIAKAVFSIVSSTAVSLREPCSDSVSSSQSLLGDIQDTLPLSDSYPDTQPFN